MPGVGIDPGHNRKVYQVGCMETIRNYIDTMFQTWPDNEATLRVKSQLTELMEDKYQALIDQGLSQHEALGQVISEFGNIEELRQELGMAEISADEISLDEQKRQKEKKKAQRKILRGNYWIIVTVVYFLVSFLTGWWALTWLLFVIAVPFESYFDYLLKHSD